MNVSLIARLLWATGFLWNVALLGVLLYRRRYRVVPWFTAWIAYGCVREVALYFGYRHGSRHLYAQLYWSAAFLDLLLQVAVIAEIARSVLRRNGQWVEGARVRLLAMAAVAPALAFAMAWYMTPAAASRLDAWDARANFFISILIVALFSGVVAASQQLGLGWRSHIMRLSYGLTVWTLASFATDTLHAYWRTLGHFSELEQVRVVVFQAVSIYWIVIFWFPEPEPTLISSETLARLNGVRSRL